MGAVNKMAPVEVCGALSYTGACLMYGRLHAAEKNSPRESYFLLEYALGDTYRRFLCSKNFKKQATEIVEGDISTFFRSMMVSSVARTQNNVQHCRSPCTVTQTAVVGKQRLRSRLFFLFFPTERGSTPCIFAFLVL